MTTETTTPWFKKNDPDVHVAHPIAYGDLFPCKVCGYVPSIKDEAFVKTEGSLTSIQCQGKNCIGSYKGLDLRSALDAWQQSNFKSETSPEWKPKSTKYEIEIPQDEPETRKVIQSTKRVPLDEFNTEGLELPVNEHLEAIRKAFPDPVLTPNIQVPDISFHNPEESNPVEALEFMVKNCLPIKGYTNSTNNLFVEKYDARTIYDESGKFKDVEEPDILLKKSDVLKAIAAIRAIQTEKTESFINSVIQDWVGTISMMQQTVLLTAIRGPDGRPKYSSPKLLLRWYRRCILLSALDGQEINKPWLQNGGSFTGPSLPPEYSNDSDWSTPMHKLVDEYLQEMDGVPLHFATHFMHGIEILGYKHPNEYTRRFWNEVYCRLCKWFHLTPETEEHLDFRLGDSRDQWAEANDSATLR